ncbi:homoserine dehydrogenase [Kiloniella laminariae]|uniref:Homoserine dehydrogenase n=1 Tax=Kiloniella laminariae TaxID=454162 RepID=A0ABT4LG52_9PROT|nr:homoserine dehydrogenase [Kiloniella laminariae]MCZ4280084.1 homoserine dehydrogenase [Kiloniella laminariae]
MSEPLKIAIAGLGTVGTGTVKLIQENLGLLTLRTGRAISIVAVSARSKKNRDFDMSDITWYDDAVTMAAESDADVVMELIGGSEGIAKEVVETAIAKGRHVITANKALLAHHGAELARKAEEAGVALAYEAAVAGGIPVIKGIREGLAANSFDLVYGILNGTCNFILSNMRETGRDFEEVLFEAQELGYAEAEPSFDVDGIDASHKLSLLASLAFGSEVDFDSVYIEGIRAISSLDIAYADELGYRIKLLGIARKTQDGIDQRVHPCMVPAEQPIALVEGVLNAVVCKGNHVGTSVFEGAGAGGGPTASAVVADLVDIARGTILPTFGIPAAKLEKAVSQPVETREGSYYLRLTVEDRPGVIADIAAILKREKISVKSLLQHESNPGKAVPLVITTQETVELAMIRALESISGLDCVLEKPNMIRIVSL